MPVDEVLVCVNKKNRRVGDEGQIRAERLSLPANFAPYMLLPPAAHKLMHRRVSTHAPVPLWRVKSPPWAMNYRERVSGAVRSKKEHAHSRDNAVKPRLRVPKPIPKLRRRQLPEIPRRAGRIFVVQLEHYPSARLRINLDVKLRRKKRGPCLFSCEKRCVRRHSIISVYWEQCQRGRDETRLISHPKEPDAVGREEEAKPRMARATDINVWNKARAASCDVSVPVPAGDRQT